MSLATIGAPLGCGQSDEYGSLTQAVYNHGDAANMSLTLPFDTPHTLTQSYGGTVSHNWGTSTEYSLDLAGKKGDPILAVQAGTIEIPTSPSIDCGVVNPILAGVVGTNGGYGNHLYVHHANGCRSHYAHLANIAVSNDASVDQGALIGREGTTGCSTATHLHFNMECPDASGNMVRVKPEPLSEYTGLGSMTGSLFHGDIYTHYPVGTLVQVAGKPEIYMVTGSDQVMHIPDWTTFVAHRFFYDSSKPMERVVTITQTALDCYRIIQGNMSWMQSKLMSCGSNLYALFRDDTRATKRMIPFATSDSRYAPLIQSWGFPLQSPTAGTSAECAAYTGANLKMRPGTVVEAASDNDFYVITSDTYTSDDVAQQAPATYAYRLNRFVNGQPFMPILYGTYGVVLQIPDGTIADFVSNWQQGQTYSQVNAWSCPAATCTPTSCSTGGGSSGAGSPTCTLGERSCADTENFVVCEADPVTGAPTWHTWPCGSGLECVNADGMCTQEVSTCTSGQRICLSTEQFADCQVDSATGENYWHPWLCGAGWECVSGSGQCTQVAYQGDAPHTIRCENHDYTYSMHVTGPIQNGIWSSVAGNTVYLQYGSNSDGWATYVPSVSSKPYSLWVGDADGSGNPYSHELVMRGDTDQLNLFLYSPDSGQQGWFNLDWGIWNVIGDCWQSGGLIYHTPLPHPSGAITCTQSGPVMKYAFSGPMQMLLVGGAASGPIDIQYGSDSDGWSVPTSGKITAPWNGSYQHEISLPAYVNNLNFYLNGSGGGRWFDLNDGDYDGDSWTVTGDCWNSGGLVTHANVAPSKTIDCQVSGSTMTVTVVGDVASGIFGTAPTASPTYLEYGSDTDGWGTYTSGKPLATWYAGTQVYTFQFNANVQNFNFFLYAPSTGSQANNWFDLSQWTTTGACYKNGGGIAH